MIVRLHRREVDGKQSLVTARMEGKASVGGHGGPPH
jgi:hypothetical protein